MKYFFGTHNNFLEMDKYNRLNKQVQLLAKKGYKFCNGRMFVPEEKQLIVAGSNPVIDGTTLTVDKTGWYSPSDLVGDDFFVHKGELRAKKTIDFTPLVTLMNFDAPEEGYPCFFMAPTAWNQIADIIFDDGIGAIKIKDMEYKNHNFLLSDFQTMESFENCMRLYIFDVIN